MRTTGLLIFVALFMACEPKSQTAEGPSQTTNIKTFCNPINISYRFGIEEPSRREAADPTVVWYKDRYFLFASKSGGYWHSQDLVEWSFVQTDQIPTEEYAPTAVVIGDTLFFLASSNEKSTIYKSTDPLNGTWSVAKEELQVPVWDPAFFLDDNDKLYLYWGCSDVNPLYGVEIDYNNDFSFVGEPVALKHQNPNEFGWEVPGDYNTITERNPWIEGAWMNKYNGKYYLQYSGPGTEFKSYSDGVYVSDDPLGPFEVQAHNPFAYKPEGFATGAGHGSTFKDQAGNYWHVGTITISQKHMFERRLGLYPAFFDEDGVLYANTKYGDFPQVIPEGQVKSWEDTFPGWMLLSYGKTVEVSSAIDSLPATNINDENIRTYWSAASGKEGEFAMIDLEDVYDIKALQINFAEHNTVLFGRNYDTSHRYLVEYSQDGESWQALLDKSKNKTDRTHAYFQLEENVECRYLKITNIATPDGHFAISGFRVFGKGDGALPEKVASLNVVRNANDRRQVSLTWNGAENAIGYNIGYGVDSTRLYQNYQVYSDTTLQINTLHKSLDYYFTIEAFNENGITQSNLIVKD